MNDIVRVMPSKATLFRLDPDAHSALVQLGKLLGRPMNKLINEAVRAYLLNTSQAESEVRETLASLSAYRERLQVAEPTVAYVAAEIAKADVDTVGAAREFVRRASARYSVRSAVLFGSRARGTHRSDSDVDIAIVLQGQRGKLIETSIEMADIAFELLLETKVYIQPLPIWEDEWNHPETHSNPQLVENIRREGLPL
jgi:predicted nucleotidyltransferase